jgi:hypothetical protein
VAAMVNEFEWNTQNTNKTQLLASNYGTFRLLVVCENFVPQNGPSPQLIDATSCVKMWTATIGAEEFVHIYSYQNQTFWADKNSKSYWDSMKKLGAYLRP